MSDPRRSPSIFSRGAVDLSALRTASDAAGSAAESGSVPATRGSSPSTSGGPASGGPASGSGAVVIDVSEATFQSEVLERSLTTPVVVDFWASWCEPCKRLTPVLEKLALEADGAWVLAKVDIDANQRLAAMLRIQSVPLVYAFVGGQPVDAFNQVVSERQARQWIEAVCRTAGVDVDASEDPRLEAAEDAIADGDLDGAERVFQGILAESPADADAAAGLAQVGLLRRTLGSDPALVLATAQDAPDDVEAQLLAADVEVLSGAAADAYQRLVTLVRNTNGDDRERVRKHLLSLFSIAGPDDPAVAASRRALASALF